MSITHETTITELAALEDLSIRAINICKANYIETLGDLLYYTPDCLLRLRSCGHKSSMELGAIIDKYRDVPRSNADSPDFYAMLDSLPLALEHWRRERNGSELIVVTSNFARHSPAVLINSILSDMVEFYQNLDKTAFGQKTYLFIDSVIEFCKEWQMHIEHTSCYRSKCLDNLIALLHQRNEEFYVLRCYQSLPKVYRKALQLEFEQQYQLLSVRTRNAFKKYSSLDSFIVLLGSTDILKTLRLRGCGSVSRTEFIRFVDRFGKEIIPLITVPEKGLAFHVEMFIRSKMLDDLDFLTYDECIYITNNYLRGEELPWIELFFKYIRRSNSRSACAYKLIYGFDNNGTELSLEQAGNLLGISSERVRQLSMKSLSFPPPLCEHSDVILKYIDRPVMADYHRVWQDIIAANNLADIDARRLMALVCAFDDSFTIVSLSPASSSYLVKKDLLKNVKLMTSLRELMKRYNMRKTQREEFSIEPYIRLSRPMSYFHSNVRLLYPIFLDYMQNLEDVECVRGEYVVMASNKISVEDCLVDILESNGSQMSFRQICDEFARRYPQYKLSSFSTLRSYILRSPKILPIGRSGRYVLAHWDKIFTGSLTELMIKCISEAGRPLSLSELYKKVSEYFPDTNEKSLTTLIYIDKGKNFVTLGASLYGLVGIDYPRLEPQVVKRSIKRLPFDQRFQQVKEFVAAHNRMPMNFGDEESTLWHWVENVEAGNISFTEEQWKSFRQFRQQCALLPQSVGELRFLQNCEKFKNVVRATGRMPSLKEYAFEYTWFNRLNRTYGSLDYTQPFSELPDNRSRYFAELKRFLSESGIV